MNAPTRQNLRHAAIPPLLGIALLTTAPHALHQPIWLSVVAASLLGWAFWRWRHDAGQPPRWLMALLVVVGSSAIFAEFHSLLGRDAGVAMLVLFMAMKQLELKTRRDATVVVNLGYFLLLTQYFHSQDIPTGLWLLSSTWLITAMQIRLHGGAPGPWRPTLRLATQLGLQAIPFMLLLYLLFPRISGPLWGLPDDARTGRTGLSEQMSPGSVANLVQNGDIAFRVRFAGAIPASDKLYWRGPVMEDFDGTTWRPAPGREAAERLEYLSPGIAYETTLEAHHRRWLLALDAPGPLPPGNALNGRLTANAAQAVDQRRRFRLVAHLDYRFNRDENPATLRRNLRLPAGLNPQSARLAADWKNRLKTPEAIVNAALQLFANRAYAYTLQPPLLGPNAIDDFLFRSRRGFCEHYAAAFVALMRSAGIPARAVGGYQGGERNPVDGYLVVRQSDAHAWAEVWLAGRGWVRVDPTAVVAPARLETGLAEALPAGENLPGLLQARAGWLRGLRYRWEAVNNAWNQQVLGYDPQRQRELLSHLGWPDADWRTLAGLLAGSGGVLLLLIGGLTLYRRPAGDPVARQWRRALRHLARRQVHCAPWETPSALARRLHGERPELAMAFDAVVAAYLPARYGPPPHDLKKLRAAIARLP